MSKEDTHKLRESQHVELKESFSDAVIETLVAFANSKGGKVIIGVSDDGSIKGVDSEAVTHNWINEVKNKTLHEVTPMIRTERVEDKILVYLEVLEHPLKPVSFKGRYFIRRGNSNHLMSTQEIAEELANTRNTSPDARTLPGYSIKDLDTREIKKVIGMINARRELKIPLRPLEFLRKYNLIIEGVPTIAALLLFSPAMSNKRKVQVGVFQDEDIIRDELICESGLTMQVNDIFEFIKKNIPLRTLITGNLQNTKRWDFPLEAIRELLTNLVVHRDYNETATIKIFPDRIVFSNYGGLPDDYRVSDFINAKRSSYVRNKLITRIFRDAGLVEEYSSGLKRVVRASLENGNGNPLFEVDSHNFTVTVRGVEKGVEKGAEKGVEELSENERKILSIVGNNPGISKAGMARMGGLTKKAVEYNLVKLKEKNLLRRVGPDKGGKWVPG